MLAVMRELKDPPRRALVTASGTASGLVDGGTGRPTISVDCGAPGRSVTSKTCWAFNTGTFSIRAGPLLQPPKLASIAFFTAAVSNLPATYKWDRCVPKFPA